MPSAKSQLGTFGHLSYALRVSDVGEPKMVTEQQFY
jgi:hypothetical protein